jgi:hypothetical protein
VGGIERVEPAPDVLDRVVAVGQIPRLVDAWEAARAVRAAAKLLGDLLEDPQALREPAVRDSDQQPQSFRFVEAGGSPLGAS